MGTQDSAGVKVFCFPAVCVTTRVNYELPFGTTFRQLIYEHAGGVRTAARDRPSCRRRLIPGVVDDKVLDTPMDYASVRTLGAELGSASIMRAGRHGRHQMGH